MCCRSTSALNCPGGIFLRGWAKEPLRRYQSAEKPPTTAAHPRKTTGKALPHYLQTRRTLQPETHLRLCDVKKLSQRSYIVTDEKIDRLFSRPLVQPCPKPNPEETEPQRRRQRGRRIHPRPSADRGHVPDRSCKQVGRLVPAGAE